MNEQSLKSQVAKGVVWMLLPKLSGKTVQFVVGERSAKEIDEYLGGLPLETPFLTAIYHFFGKKYYV